MHTTTAKKDLIDWAFYNRVELARHELFATGITGRLIAEALDRPVQMLQSGPLGGDLQIGARIAEGKIDILIFFCDPMEAQPHDPDVRALLRIGVKYSYGMRPRYGRFPAYLVAHAARV